MLSSTPYQPFLVTAEAVVAEAAARVLPSVQDRAAVRKTDGTLVTATDHAIDQQIRRRLAATYPDHAILSEEQTTTYDPSVRYTWVLDPLDGTTNFARGLAVWGISLALLEFGVPVVAVVAFPSLHELFLASQGGGAACNGVPIATAPQTTLDDEHFLMCCTRTGRHYTVSTPLKPRILGSAAYHLLKVADGTALAAVEATPMLWDLAAALLILQEAGGVHTALDGTPIFPLPSVSIDYKRRPFPLMAAANQTVLATLRSGVQPRTQR